MIGATGDVTNQYLVRANYSDNADQRAVVKQENDMLRAERPVETAGEGSRAETGTKDKTIDKNVCEEGKIVFKRYNSSGDVIFRVPPEAVNKHV